LHDSGVWASSLGPCAWVLEHRLVFFNKR
jgi:hypothetical protein